MPQPPVIDFSQMNNFQQPVNQQFSNMPLGLNNGAINLNGIGVLKNNSINQMYFNSLPAQNQNKNMMSMPYQNQNQYQMMYNQNGQQQFNYQQPYSNQQMYQQQLQNFQPNTQFQHQNPILFPNQILQFNNQIANQFPNTQDQRNLDSRLYDPQMVGINANYSSSLDSPYQTKVQTADQSIGSPLNQMNNNGTKTLNQTLQMPNPQLSFTSDHQNLQSYQQQLLNQTNNSFQQQFQGQQQFMNQIHPQQQFMPLQMYSNFINQQYPAINVADPYRNNFIQFQNPINYDQKLPQNNQFVNKAGPIESSIQSQQNQRQEVNLANQQNNQDQISQNLSSVKTQNTKNLSSVQTEFDIEQKDKTEACDQKVKNQEESGNIESKILIQNNETNAQNQEFKNVIVEEVKDRFEIEESIISMDIESFRQSEISTIQNFNKEILRNTSNKTLNVIASKQKKKKKTKQENSQIQKTVEKKVDQSMISQATNIKQFDSSQIRIIDDGCSVMTEHQIGLQHMQMYVDKLIFHINQNKDQQDEQCRKNVIELLQCYDELYSEVLEGQVILRRNPLTLKFEILTFIDISNIFKEKKQKAIKVLNQLTKLNHPNIVSYSEEHKPYQLLDTKKSQNSVILVKQEAPDHLQNWKSFCKRPFNTMQILSILRQMCLALSYIHDQGIIIRDIHPSRIHQINKIAKLNLIGLPKNFKKLLKNETFCGHVHYSAPEMLNENENLTEKVDIWALGCCIYYLSSKKNPFDSETPEKIKWNIRNLRIDNNMYMIKNDQQQQMQNQSYPSLILNTQNLSKIYSGQRDQILDDLIWICLKENHTHRPRAIQLLSEIDRLEMAYYGRQMLSFNITKQLIDINQQNQESLYVQKYERNPNQTKNNPEFFSKKVGDKLMKILTVEEMLDQNQIIKKKILSEQELNNLLNEFSSAFQLSLRKINSDLSEVYFQSKIEEGFVEDSSQFEYFSGSQNQNKSDDQKNSACLKSSRNDTQEDLLKSQKCESPIIKRGQIFKSKEESLKAQSIGKSSTQTSQQRKKIIEEQLYDLISDKSKIQNNQSKSQFNSSKKRYSINQIEQKKISAKTQIEQIEQSKEIQKQNQQEVAQIELHNKNNIAEQIIQNQSIKKTITKQKSFDDPIEQQQTPFFEMKINQSTTPKKESPVNSQNVHELEKQKNSKIVNLELNNVFKDQNKKDNNIQYFQLKCEKIENINNQNELSENINKNELMECYDEVSGKIELFNQKKQNEILPSPQILKEQFNKKITYQQKDGPSSSKSSSSSQNKKPKSQKKLRNHTPINQLSKFAKDYLIQEADDDLLTEKPSRKVQSKEQKFKFQFSNQRDHEIQEQNENIQNRKELIQNLYENKKKINGIETNLSKEQIMKNEKMYERRMSFAVGYDPRQKSKIIDEFESQYQNLMKIRSNSIQVQFDQIEKVKQIIENDAKQLNSQQISNYIIGSQNKKLEEIQDAQTVINDQKSSQKDQLISKSSQSPMSAILQKLTNSHVNENNKEYAEAQNKIVYQNKQDVENQNQIAKEDVNKKKQKKKESNQRSLSQFSNPQILNANRFNQFQSELDSSSEEYENDGGHQNQKSQSSKKSSNQNKQSKIPDDMLSQYSIDSNIKQILRGPYGIQNNSSKNRKQENYQDSNLKQQSEDECNTKTLSKFNQRSKSRKPLNSQKNLNIFAQQIELKDQFKTEKKIEEENFQNLNIIQFEKNSISDESVESKKILQQYKNYAPPQIKKSHVRVSYKDSIKLNHQRSFSQSSIDKNVKKDPKQEKISQQKVESKMKNLDKIIEEDQKKEDMQSSQEDVQSSIMKSAHFFNESSNSVNQNKQKILYKQSSDSIHSQIAKQIQSPEKTKNEFSNLDKITQNNQLNEKIQMSDKVQNQFFDIQSNLSTIHNVEHQEKTFQNAKNSIENLKTNEQKKDSVFGNYIINRDHSINSTQYNQSVQSVSFNNSNFFKQKSSRNNKQKDSKSSFFKDSSIVEIKNQNLNASSGQNSSSINESFEQTSQSVKSKYSKQSSEKCQSMKQSNFAQNKNARGRSGFYQIQQSEKKIQESLQKQNNLKDQLKLSQSFEHLQASLKNQLNNDVVKQDFMVEDFIKLNTTASIYSKGTFGISNNAKQQLQSECMSVTRSSADNSALSFQIQSHDLQKENQIVTYTDGSKFIGQIKRQGKGTLYSSDGSIYIGNWADDRKNGHGKIKFANEETYEGNWENDMINGQGIYTYNSGDIYKGSFINGMKDGFGIMEFSNNEKYEGYWKQDNFMGDKGEYSFANGNRYKGEFLNGKFEGQGELILPNEGKYTGQFKLGSINGHGKFEYNDGSFYEGEWKDCLMNGKGLLFQAKDSTIFEGNFQDGKKNGIGILTKENESKIKGFWKNDELEKIITYENLQALDELLNSTKQ